MKDDFSWRNDAGFLAYRLSTMGTQNHEKWRFYTPNVWVIIPKIEGCGSHGRWWLQIFVFSSPFGELIQFDHFFQVDWNHQQTLSIPLQQYMEFIVIDAFL